MYLKRIEFFGFKSFADKTTVDFLPGVTCVVGPNGCGKSNISDAIRWVLGERSAKMLRGSKMEDVIFTGTSFRKPLNMAEVSLTIDNRDKVLSIGYEEVVLTRRLFRSGESEYLINKTPCRYKDIQDLIMDTGIGSHSYSMIEQGRIDYILQAEPEERRFLIEEAAGISRFKSQKEEAIRKLERTENNMLRLTDIVSEVEKNIKYAERQAKRAERYREYYEDLKRKEISRSLVEVRDLERRSGEAGEEFAALKVEDQETAARVEGLKKAFIDWERQEEEKLQELRFKEGKRFELKSEIQNRESSKAFNFEKTGEIKNQIETLEKEIATINEARAALETSRENGQKELEELAVRHKGLESEFSEFLERVTALERAAGELKGREKFVQDRIFENAGSLAALRNEMHGFELRRASAEISLKRSREEFTSTDSELAELRSRWTQIEGDLKEKRTAFDSIETENKDLAAQDQGLEAERAETLLSAERISKEYHDITARIQILEELQTHLYEKEGLDETALERLDAERNIRPLFKELRIKQGFEKGVETVLGPLLKALLVRSAEDLKALATILDQETFSQIPAIVTGELLSQGPAGPFEGSSQVRLLPVEEVITADARWAGLIVYLFRSTYFVEDEIADEDFFSWSRQCPSLRIIHRSGKIWGPGPLLFLAGNKEIESFFAKRKEWEVLLNEKPRKDAEKGDLEAKLADISRREDMTRSKIAERREALRGLEIELQVRSRELEDVRTLIEKKERECSLYQTEARQKEEEIAELTEQLSNEEKRLAHLAEEEGSQKAELSRIQNELADRTEETDKALEEKTRKELETAGITEKIKFLEDRLSAYSKQLKDEEEKKGRYDQKIVEYRERLQDIRFHNDRLENELKDLRETLSRDEISIHQLERERLLLQEQKRKISEDLTQKEKALEEIRLKLHRLEMETKEIVHLRSRVSERVLETYKVDLNTLTLTPEEEAGMDLTQLDSDIAALKEKLSGVGTVNLLAVEEYNELKTRFDFLNSQKMDLEKAREELLEAIRKINRTTKKLFEETYDQVRTNFQEFFRTLFGGGRAELVIMDEANPLDSGIDIFVQPPGKKNQNISLLSGGEKALTAIALLFSLFKIKPSPFSVLDEIDAPLDEANIDRFLTVLESFLNKTQFIIVTHNRKTIAMGTTLYGVTMQEPGVSKVVSVKLQEESAAQKSSVTEQALSANIHFEQESES